MKQIIKWWAICLWTILMGACDKIDSDNRWTSDGEIAIPEEDQRTVLVEEYTGQNCINCPQAAAELKKIAKLYPGKVITVALHAMRTGQARPELASEAADFYASEYHIPASVPGVMINRQNLGHDLYSQKKALWSSLITSRVNIPARYRMELSASIDKENQIAIKVSARTMAEVPAASENLGIQLWAVEDIRTEQAMPNGKKTDYFHHNVLRGALNGNNGSDFHLDKEYTLKASLPAGVKVADNAKVVAFLFNKKSREVYETAIVALGDGIKDDTDNPDTEEKPGPDGQGPIYFLCEKDTVQSGGNAITEKIEVREDKTVEMVSPLIYIKPGEMKGKGPFTLVIQKEDHQGEQFGGLTQICANGNCQDASDKELFSVEMDDLNESEFIQVHYLIAEGMKKEARNYSVIVSIVREKKELAFLHLKFRYNPENLPGEKPVEPQPNPEPEPENPPTPQPVPPTPPHDNGKSNVLVMDFTGQRCGYCIYEIRTLERLQAEYQGHLLVAGIHTPSYTQDSNFIFEEWYEYANRRVTGYPTLIWNNKVKSRDSDEMARQYINTSPQCHSVLNAQIKDKRIALSFKSTPTPDHEQAMAQREVNVLFWVTENKVMGYQAGEGYNFVHNHILRGYLNTLWGERYTFGKQIETVKDFPEKVLQPQHCELIAIILDAKTLEFLDAVKVNLQ